MPALAWISVLRLVGDVASSLANQVVDLAE